LLSFFGEEGSETTLELVLYFLSGADFGRQAGYSWFVPKLEAPTSVDKRDNLDLCRSQKLRLRSTSGILLVCAEDRGVDFGRQAGFCWFVPKPEAPTSVGRRDFVGLCLS